MTEDREGARRQLRETLREARRKLPSTARVAAAERLADALLALPFAPRSGPVAGYWATDGEIALHAWQLRLPRDCIYCLPVLGKGHRLHFAPWRAGRPLVQNRFGIPEPDVPPTELLEPEAMRMVVLPLVGFDRRGHRLGMGGGWYDRNFAFRRNGPAPPWLVGAAFDLQRLDHLDAADWDVPLDAVCTETAVHDHRSRSEDPA
ncbi:5-formyltetrahydrofolate cyclo-ligase [Marilutibacter aestuarii]|uniref:5-formyltetrahydrofolate cyclo-ligase n=1 Tax=Marilutibacter aestuarii TaxID=1706195 RepID=A0A508ACA7_9GAMM|nr:5-formyltetrahydrofolate cyclo-ligase [Lysobacter aestuarii]TQD47037.1 5-formyltetrahydrofolate cyclo-ligase [Lysobacter aestuarii]